MHESLDDVLDDSTPEREAPEGVAHEEPAGATQAGDDVKRDTATSPHGREPAPAPAPDARGAARAHVRPVRPVTAHNAKACVMCGAMDHMAGHCPNKSEQAAKDWDAAVLAARNKDQGLPLDQDTALQASEPQGEGGAGSGGSKRPGGHDEPEGGRGRSSPRRGGSGPAQPPAAGAALPAHRPRRSRSRDREERDRARTLAVSPPRQWGSKAKARSPSRGRGPPASSARWGSGDAPPKRGEEPRDKKRRRSASRSRSPRRRGGGGGAASRAPVLPGGGGGDAAMGTQGTGNASVDAIIGEARGLKRAAEAISGGLDQAMLLMKASLMFMRACAMQEAGVAVHVPGEEHQQRKYAAALLFAQTGKLCEHTASLCDALLRTCEPPKLRAVLLLRLLMLRLSLLSSCRALALRRDALCVDAACIIQRSQGDGPAVAPPEAVLRCATATSDACAAVDVWLAAVAAGKAVEGEARGDAALCEAVAVANSLTKDGGWGDLGQQLDQADVVASAVQQAQSRS